jgi:epoxyqueuosine reductase
VSTELPAPEPAAIKQNLVRIAKELGFGDCRIAPALPARHGDIFRQWVEDACYGDMAWLAKGVERRIDPREVLPGAKSVIVLAMNYFQGDMPSGKATSPGTFARYAWGSDYHDLIEDKLKDLSTYIDDVGGRHRYYVDTGPVLERDFAGESGLGWNGKSTVQIHRKLGTWFFLAVILTDLPLPADERMTDHCGKCTRCMDACPTQAITAERRLDARRCISYLTIEHRGSIPVEFREAMGDRIYGCDDCLTVCPWNRFAQASQEAMFQARPFVNDWNLRDFLSLDVEGFRDLFKKSPVKRTKRSGFLRNVCVALGNVGTVEDVPALEKAVAEEDELIAEHACWALEKIAARG